MKMCMFSLLSILHKLRICHRLPWYSWSWLFTIDILCGHALTRGNAWSAPTLTHGLLMKTLFSLSQGMLDQEIWENGSCRVDPMGTCWPQVPSSCCGGRDIQGHSWTHSLWSRALGAPAGPTPLGWAPNQRGLSSSWISPRVVPVGWLVGDVGGVSCPCAGITSLWGKSLRFGKPINQYLSDCHVFGGVNEARQRSFMVAPSAFFLQMLRLSELVKWDVNKVTLCFRKFEKVIWYRGWYDLGKAASPGRAAEFQALQWFCLPSHWNFVVLDEGLHPLKC